MVYAKTEENLNNNNELLDQHCISEYNYVLMMDVSELCYSFVEDVSKRTKQMDKQYLLGLKKFFSIYLDTFSSTEPQLSATAV